MTLPFARDRRVRRRPFSRGFVWGLLLPLAWSGVVALLAPDPVRAATRCEVPTEAQTVRPGPADEPTRVEIDFYVIDIEAIDDARQEFTSDVVVRARWHDPRLGAVARARGAPCVFPYDGVWNPFLQMMNRRDVQTRLPAQVHVDVDGAASSMRRLYGTFSSPFDLRQFPFDRQDLPFTVVSFLDERLVELVAPIEESGRDDRFSLPGWEVGPFTVSTSTYEARFGAGEVRPKSRIDLVFSVHRDIRFYQWKVVLPLVLIVFMSWSVFFVDPSQVGPQLGAASTSILTLIAFLFSLRGILPPISYLTRMDFFVYASLGLVFLAYLEALFTVGLASTGRAEVAKRIDRTARILLPLLFAGIVARFMIG